MVPMLGMFQLGSRMGVSGERQLQATLFANEVIERVRGEMDRWALNSKGRINMPRMAMRPPHGFSYQVTNEQLESGLATVKVLVYWKEGRVKRKLELEALISRAGSITMIPKNRGGRRLRSFR